MRSVLLRLCRGSNYRRLTDMRTPAATSNKQKNRRVCSTRRVVSLDEEVMARIFVYLVPNRKCAVAISNLNRFKDSRYHAHQPCPL